MDEKPKKSVSHARELKGYLDPFLHNKLPRLREITGYNKSEVVNEAVRLLMEQKNIIPAKT